MAKGFHADSRSRLTAFAALFGLALTALVSLLAFRADAAQEQARDTKARAQAVGALQMLTSGIENRLLDVRGLFVASDAVNEREFHAFTQPMIETGNAFYWLEKVEGPTATRFPIRYAATPDASARRRAKGYDPFQDPTRRVSMLRSVVTGSAQSTPLVTLAVRARPGLVIYAPVYRPGGRHTLDDVVGMAVGSFTIGDARAAVRGVVAPGTAVRVRIDGTDAFATGPVDPASPGSSFVFAGRSWTVQTHTAGAAGLELGPVATIGGLLVTLLLVLSRWWRSSRTLLEGGRDRAERRFADVFAAAPIGMTLIDRSGTVVRVNQALCDLIGCTEAELRSDANRRFAFADDQGRLVAAFADAAARPGQSIQVEARLNTTRGVRWTEQHVTFLPDERLTLVQAVDIQHRREFEAQLVHQAEHDSLTDLLNRRGLSRILEAHQRTRAGGAVLLLDLDHFKAINDLHGHGAGDEVLVAAADLITSVVRDGDAVARMGGDEFAILLADADEHVARVTAQRLVDVFDAGRFESETGSHALSISVGVAMLTPALEDPDAALVAADLAMYDAKADGRGRLAVYDETSARSHTRDRLIAVARVRAALAENRFFLVAQPIRSLCSGEIVHHELLLRMREPDGGVLPPAAFLGVAEEFGLIGEIDLWVVRNAISILDVYSGRDVAFHVNLSGRSLGEPALLEKIRAEFARTGVDPCRLVFEITETAAVGNLEQARAFATALTDIGCRLALDDFGAGFSSFVYLKQLPFDILKIDGEFVRQCTTTPADRVILESLVHTASGLGKETVAEFVEDQETEDLLRELGVDLVQGHHVGRPVDVHAAIAALAQV
ncbi:EAL domain-containing protein [Solirubrobacter taibaiensis]|nr:EAL domain-containing protein [Solirubrobacter taibaiensis]